MSAFIRNQFVHEALMHHPSSTLAYQLTASSRNLIAFAYRPAAG
jgi:hypothetical protein